MKKHVFITQYCIIDYKIIKFFYQIQSTTPMAFNDSTNSRFCPCPGQDILQSTDTSCRILYEVLIREREREQREVMHAISNSIRSVIKGQLTQSNELVAVMFSQRRRQQLFIKTTYKQHDYSVGRRQRSPSIPTLQKTQKLYNGPKEKERYSTKIDENKNKNKNKNNNNNKNKNNNNNNHSTHTRTARGLHHRLFCLSTQIQ